MISKQTKYYLSSAVLSTILLTGCGGGSSSSTTPTDDTEENTTTPIIEESLSITEEYQVAPLASEGEESVNLHIKVETDTPKDLYLVFSNTATDSSASVDIEQSSKYTISTTQRSLVSAPTPKITPTPEKIRSFNAQLLKPDSNTLSSDQKVILVKSERSEGDTKTFYLDLYDSGDSTNATLKKIIANVETEFGSKTLNIWVSDDSFDSGSGCEKERCVTQEMVDALASTFLQNDPSNDIYDWVTNIFGEEWGSAAQDKYSNLIGESDEINILLTDIDNDNATNGGVIGYFYSKDNYSTDSLSGSNEMIMFYIDSVLFANGDDEWDMEDFWPRETVSTLAHEFQHMIHFYQKTILRTNGQQTDTWLNEMLSETIEEVISTKIHHDGPRGVDYTDGSAGEPGNIYGRYPLFNEYNMLSLTSWNNYYADYSKVNAFGAYLTRNYGVGVLHDIMQSSYVHEDAVEYAINNTANGEGKNFNDLLQEWGIAVMLSDHDDLDADTPTYNTGDFIESSFKDTTYDLGSINFFNYDPQPTIYTTGGTVQPQGNYYYKIGENISGTLDVNITLNGTTNVTLIAK